MVKTASCCITKTTVSLIGDNIQDLRRPEAHILDPISNIILQRHQLGYGLKCHFLKYIFFFGSNTVVLKILKKRCTWSYRAPKTLTPQSRNQD